MLVKDIIQTLTRTYGMDEEITEFQLKASWNNGKITQYDIDVQEFIETVTRMHNHRAIGVDNSHEDIGYLLNFDTRILYNSVNNSVPLETRHRAIVFFNEYANTITWKRPDATTFEAALKGAPSRTMSPEMRARIEKTIFMPSDNYGLPDNVVQRAQSRLKQLAGIEHNTTNASVRLNITEEFLSQPAEELGNAAYVSVEQIGMLKSSYGKQIFKDGIADLNAEIINEDITV